ncbi:MAG: discoidin domain-containing protein [Spirochaetales bacterium]|nr:discoidin domain-containing protein [Spirochaetales bacterium]
MKKIIRWSYILTCFCLVFLVSVTAFARRTTSTSTPTPVAVQTNTPVSNTPAPTTPPSNVNLALNRPATSSSDENASFSANYAVDGNTGTRWSSGFSDPQWLQVDLGTNVNVSSVVLRWEAAYATAFQIQISSNASTWTTLYSTSSGSGGNQTISVSGSGRYIRMYGTARSTAWGYSLWEFEVYGSGGTVPTTASTNTPVPTTALTATPTQANTNTPTPSSPPSTTNIALGKPATSSSNENDGTAANYAVDGNTGTRWSSAFSDPQWLQVDLGSTATVSSVVLRWETACATAYQIQISSNASTWTTLYSTTSGSGGTVTHNVSGSGRYIRMYGTSRATAWGYSLWEFEVYGTGGSTVTATPTPTTGGSTPTPVSDFWGDVNSIPVGNQVLMCKFLNRTNGRYADNQVYWSFQSGGINVTTTIAAQDTYDMPANSAGRMYFALGAPPNAANPDAYWDFIEFTIGPTQFNGNTTRVDAIGLKIAMRLICDDGYDVQVGENQATFAEDRETLFQRFRSTVPAEFQDCANLHYPYRIVEPGAAGFNEGGPYANYYNSYVDQIWANNGITIPKPGANAQGLGAYPDLSAAIYRHVGAAAGTFNADGSLRNQSLWSNPATFYTAAPAHYYAKFCHDISINGYSYGFPYDDVGGYSSFISHNDPKYLIIAIGW